MAKIWKTTGTPFFIDAKSANKQPFHKKVVPYSAFLVVDDTPENLTAICCLYDGICNVAAVSNGAEALVTAPELKPDLIPLDVLIPGMDGFATCRKLNQNPETAIIPVIFVTSLDTLEDKLEQFHAEEVDYVTKPFHAGEIRERVSTHLRIRHMEKIAGPNHQVRRRDQGLSCTMRISCQ
jgi:CheY-like chemotaxis protein